MSILSALTFVDTTFLYGSNALPPSAAAAAAASSSSSSSAARLDAAAGPLRLVEPPSLTSQPEPDALNLVLLFALGDLPAALHQTFFPKELIQIVAEYASEICFIAEFDGPSEGPSIGLMKRRVIGATSDFVRWLGAQLPPGFNPKVYDEQGQICSDEGMQAVAHSNSCLMGEKIAAQRGRDLTRLLQAQLEPHEYLGCYQQISPAPIAQAGKYGQLDLSAYTAGLTPEDHNQFCLDELNKRKAAIAARGQTPVAVPLRKLLDRLRSTLQAGNLPRGLSPRPSDWAPLFSWIRSFWVEWNAHRRQLYLADHDEADPDDEPGVCPFVSPLCTVTVQAAHRQSHSSMPVVSRCIAHAAADAGRIVRRGGCG